MPRFALQVVARFAVRLVRHSIDRVVRQYLVSLIHQPVECRGRVIDGQPRDHRIDRAAAYPHQVVEVLLGRVGDALLALQPGTGGAHLAAREQQCATDLRRRIDDPHARTALCGEDRRRQAGGTGPDDQQIAAPAH